MEGDDQRFCLQWNGFRNSITTVFEELRQDEELVDITLCCEGKKVKAHRMMLSACSPYFRDLLKENPCQHPVFFLKDTTYNDLQAVIEFVYNGEVNVTRAQISSFLKTAEMLQVRGLTGDDDQDSVSAPASPRTQHWPASPATPSPVSRSPAPVRRLMVPADPPDPQSPPVNSVTAAGRTAATPAESPPVSPATKRRRLYPEFGSNDGLETSAAAASAAFPAATPPSVGAPPPPPPPLPGPASMVMPPTDPAGSSFAQSGKVKVEKIDRDIADDDEDLAAREHVDYGRSYVSNQPFGAIPVTDACQGEQATPTLQENPLREPFTHGWRREIVHRIVGGEKFDCYYFTPAGKRLRSLKEVQTILDETNSKMSISCFSLQRRLVGVGPPHEIERQAEYNRAVARFTGISASRGIAPNGWVVPVV